MPDDKSEAETIWRQYYGKPDELATELTMICLTKLGVVYQVFALLNDYYDFDVGCRFFKKVNHTAVLQMLLETNEGISFCRKLYDMLNAGWSGYPLLQTCSATQGDLILFKIMIDGAKAKPNDTSRPRQLTEAETDYYKNLAKKKGEKFNEEIVWDLPTAGAGFDVYNQDDLKNSKTDIYGYDQIGTKEAVENVMRLAKEWAAQSDQKLQIGDLSRPGGIITPDHHGHRTGKIVDIRPLRNPVAFDTLPLTYTDKRRYSLELTKIFIRFVRNTNLVNLIRFNDGEIANDQEFRGYVLKDPKGNVHDNHLHLEFR